jgi:hypothetical protein
MYIYFCLPPYAALRKYEIFLTRKSSGGFSEAYGYFSNGLQTYAATDMAMTLMSPTMVYSGTIFSSGSRWPGFWTNLTWYPPHAGRISVFCH